VTIGSLCGSLAACSPNPMPESLRGGGSVKPILDAQGRLLRAGGAREWWVGEDVLLPRFAFQRVHPPRCPEDAGFVPGSTPRFVRP
jgi:hypothetical protein